MVVWPLKDGDVALVVWKTRGMTAAQYDGGI